MRRDASFAVLSVVCVGLACTALLRTPPGARVPPRMPTSAAQAWMTDALPGIGQKTRERMAAAIRANTFEQLPARARPLAEQVFARDAHDD
jgi:hypothetical protein